MSDTLSASGDCLCGASRIEAKNIARNVSACHCSMCRNWGGGPFLTLDCGTAVVLHGENITIYDSSEWAQRGFCGKCGTHLFYRLRESQQYFVPAGLFAFDGDELRFDHQIFIDEKPPFYRFANETINMTGAEVFAKYAPSGK